MKTTILLINLGTPDSPDTGAVRKYLREFLLDVRVIDMNPKGRYLLVNGLIALFRAGKKKLLFLSPAFVSDCLETTVGIGVEYQEVFEEYGGEKIQLVPSLNSNDFWVDAVKEIIDKNRLYT